MIVVDLVFLSRDLSPPRADVGGGIAIQDGVSIRMHRVVGVPRRATPIDGRRSRGRGTMGSGWGRPPG